MKNIHLVALLFSLFIVAACNKPKDGAPGPQGLQGLKGNANVSTSTFTTTSWGVYDNGGIKIRYCNLNVPAITSAIASNGSVAVYTMTSDLKESIALPFTYPNGNSGKTSTLQYGYLINEVSLTVASSDGSDPGDLGAVTIKVVVTAGAN